MFKTQLQETVDNVLPLKYNLRQDDGLNYHQGIYKLESTAIDKTNNNEFEVNGAGEYEPSSLSYFSNPMGKFDRLAVEVREAEFSYGRGKKAHPALRGVNLRVPEGIIYGLLGPSGCGKTTLLNTVVGVSKLKTGVVKVFDERPGSENSIVPGRGVGFMPQELALYPEFTIKEIITYFGKLHHIDAKTLKERTKFLIDFLHLPKSDVQTQNLSGGQQRRVSLAAALIHKPPLLVLDEPTVGVDPMLRQSIWEYLVGLTTNEGMTVIITTHYIEEAAQANVVGLMRKGQLLAEASPKELMLRLNEHSLEKCFLKLCKMDKEIRGITKSTCKSNTDLVVKIAAIERREETHLPVEKLTLPMDDVPHSMSTSTIDLIKNSSTDLTRSSNNAKDSKRSSSSDPKELNAVQDNFYKIMTLFHKNVIRLRRNIIIFGFNFGLPAFLVLIMCICVGPDPKQLPLAVVNEDKSQRLSKLYLEAINNDTILQKAYPDQESAIASVKSGETWGMVHLGPGFSQDLLKRLSEGFDASNETIISGSINVNLDNTNQQIGFTIKGALVQAFHVFSQNMLEASGASPLLANAPVVFGTPIFGDAQGDFTEFIAPGIIMSMAYYLAVALTLLSLVQEYKSGLLNRSFVSGITPFQVLASQMLTQSLVLVGQIAGILCITFWVFNIPARGPFFWVIALISLQGISGMSFGLLISSAVSDEVEAIFICLASLYPSTLLTGMMWPIEAQPTFLRYISMSLPQTIPTEALRSVMSRGWGIEYSVVWVGVLVMFAWTAICFILAVVVFKMKK